MQWNFNIQREIMTNTVFTVGYVGSHNLHLNNQKDFNYPVPFTGPTGLPTFGVYSATANAVIANPRLNPFYGYLQMIDALGASHYESLQASLNRRFSNGFQYLVTYSFSKSIDESSGSYGLDGGGAVYNPTSATADTGLSNFNRKHNFRASAIYDVPAEGTRTSRRSGHRMAAHRHLHLLVGCSVLSGHDRQPSRQRHRSQRRPPQRGCRW
jgi:hypothetical protein